MTFTETVLHGVYLVDLEPIRDTRGWFSRVFDEAQFAERGLQTSFPQWSISRSDRAGTLRGLHYQRAPAEEVKLVRCTAGSVFDVVVDLRPASPSYRRWVGAELSADNHRMMYIPGGVAHGVQTLAPDTEVFYAISASYRAELQAGYRWDDPAFGIQWPPATRTISDRDLQYPAFVP